MRGESMKGKSKKSTYSTTFGVDPNPDAKNGGTEGGKHLANSAILRSTQSGRNIFVKR